MKWLVPDKSSNVVSVSDVLHVLALTCELFSISQATRKEFAISFIEDDCYIFRDTKLIGSAPKINNIYICHERTIHTWWYELMSIQEN